MQQFWCQSFDCEEEATITVDVIAADYRYYVNYCERHAYWQANRNLKYRFADKCVFIDIVKHDQ